MQDFEGGKRNWVLDHPDGLEAPLTNTLVLDRGTGDPTFTRATTATVEDFEGLIKTVKSNEARFKGARRVENLIPDSKDFTGWTKGDSAAITADQAIAPDGTMTADEIDLTGGASARVSLANIIANNNKALVYTVYLKAKASNGTVVLGGRDAATTYHRIVVDVVTTEWRRYYLTIPAVSGGSTSLLELGNLQEGGTCLNFYASDVQLEDVTGQTNQNPSEYVSTGVNAIGDTIVENGDFETDTYWSKGTGCTIDGEAIYLNVANNTAGIYKSGLLTVGKPYRVIYSLSEVTTGAVKIQAGSFDGVERSSVGTYEETIYPASNGNFYLTAVGTTTLKIDNISIREIGHGCNVDGVKYFDTFNGNSVASNVVTEATGAPIPASTLKGVVVENAATNLLTYSEDFSDASWVKSSGFGVTANATTAPDGTETADLLIPTTGGNFVETYQNAVVTNGVIYTQTYYVKTAGLRYIQLVGPNAVFGFFYVNFDLQTGVVSDADSTGTTGLLYSIESVDNGFYRIRVTVKSLAGSGNARVAINCIKTATTTRGQDEGNFSGTDGYYVWGAQLE